MPFKKHDPLTSAALSSNVQHIHFPNGKKQNLLFTKKIGFVKYKILLIFRPAMSIAVFEIFIFILYITSNMDSGYAAFVSSFGLVFCYGGF